MNTLFSASSRTYIVALLVVIFIWALKELIRAGRLSKNPTIIMYVNKMSNSELEKNEINQEVLSELQLQLMKKDIRANRLTIRQSITMAISSKKQSVREQVVIDQVQKSINVDEIDKLSGVQFESLLRDYFVSIGFKVSMTKASGDQGADLILVKEQRRIAVQAKRHATQAKLGNASVQEVISGRIYYECTEACVITTTYFTAQAVELARRANVVLIDRRELIKMLNGRYSL
ncbi:restriction endonuclease [Paenibacillus sp. MMO-177]|uniref:restriction endonuclease n=1 Tax=Paenibacillus sp. MMO-177 TaxID=3081289 RepID=UPI003018739D